MKLPEIVKRIGYTDGEDRIYVEDYVYSYLKGLREKRELIPLRAALFGHAVRKDAIRYYFIYGACCIVEEFSFGGKEEQVRKEFFPEYELIGYVNICKNSRLLEDKGKGYFVFYEANEPMQRYLAFCFERENKRGGKKAEENTDIRESARPGRTKGGRAVGEAVKRFFYGMGILILAIAINTVNDYGRMYGFVEMTGMAAQVAEK